VQHLVAGTVDRLATGPLDVEMLRVTRKERTRREGGDVIDVMVDKHLPVRDRVCPGGGAVGDKHLVGRLDAIAVATQDDGPLCHRTADLLRKAGPQRIHRLIGTAEALQDVARATLCRALSSECDGQEKHGGGGACGDRGKSDFHGVIDVWLENGPVSRKAYAG
jgi:hypothetical protein